MNAKNWLVGTSLVVGILFAQSVLATTQQQNSCTVSQVVTVGTSYAHIRCNEASPGQGGNIFYFAVKQSDPRLEGFVRMGQTALMSGRKMLFSYTFETAGETTCNATDCRTAINFGMF